MTVDGNRLVVVGRNSTVWNRVRPRLSETILELSHGDIGSAKLAPNDVVWIFSYSRDDEENRRMFAALAAAGARRVVYVSSATAPVGERHRCYSYPRCKFRAERAASELLDARIVRLGLVYDRAEELPGGTSLATTLASITDAIRLSLRSGPQAVSRDLFEPTAGRFGSAAERLAHRLYGALIRTIPAPCLLRPLDLVLSALGWRWYGYLYLSNRQWLMTT